MTEVFASKSWRLVTSDAAGKESISAAVLSLKDALGWACDLIAQGVKVERIQCSDGEVVSMDAVVTWCKAHRA